MSNTPANGQPPRRRPRKKAKYVYRWYEGPVREDGTRERRQQSFDRLQDKADFIDELRRLQQVDGLVSLTRDVTVAEFVETWWELHAIPNLEASTRTLYKGTWGRHLQRRIGGYKLREVTPEVVGDLQAQLLRAGLGPATVLKAMTVLQSVMSLAVRHRRIPRNPVAEVRKPSQTPARQVAPVPPLLVEQLRSRLSPRDAAMVAVLAYAGLRPQELLALEWVDVADTKLFIHRKNVDGTIKPYTKTRVNRSVDLLAPLAQDLRELRLAGGRRGGLVFPRPDGKPWLETDWRNWRRRAFQPAARKVGLPSPVPYDLRGSFVSLLVWEGRNLLEVAHQAGHSVQTCEDHYARIFNDFDPAKRTSAVAAIRAARDAVGRGPGLFDAAELS